MLKITGKGPKPSLRDQPHIPRHDGGCRDEQSRPDRCIPADPVEKRERRESDRQRDRESRGTRGQ